MIFGLSDSYSSELESELLSAFISFKEIIGLGVFTESTFSRVALGTFSCPLFILILIGSEGKSYTPLYVSL